MSKRLGGIIGSKNKDQYKLYDKIPYCGCDRSFYMLLEKKQLYIKQVTLNIYTKIFSDTPISQP